MSSRLLMMGSHNAAWQSETTADWTRTPDFWEPISSCFEKFILKVRKCCMVLWAVILGPCSKSKQKCAVSRESQEGGALAPGEGGMKDHLTNQADRYWFTWFLRTFHFPHLLSGAPPTRFLLFCSMRHPVSLPQTLSTEASLRGPASHTWVNWERKKGFSAICHDKIRKWQTYQQKFL